VKKLPVLIVGSPSETGGTYGIHIDLSEIKKLDLQKRISEQIIKNSSEAIVILDKNHKITLWNNGAEKMFGYKEADVLNKKIATILIPKELQEENKKIIEEVEEKAVLRNYETKRKTLGGEKIDVSVSVTKVMDKSNKFIGYLISYRDITQQKKTGNELQQRFETIQDAYKELGLQRRHLDYLYEIIDSTVDPAIGIESLERLIVSALCLLTKADATILRIYDEPRKVLKLASYFGVSPKWLDKNQIKFDNSIASEAFELNRPIIIDDIDLNPKHQGSKLLKMHRFKTMVLLPLSINKKIFGTISLYSTDVAKFRMIETDFLEKIGKQCAISIFAKRVSSK
jgi:PAS domain S-box-containing protein